MCTVLTYLLWYVQCTVLTHCGMYSVPYLLTVVCTVYCSYLLRYVQCTVLTYCGLYSILTLEVVPAQILHDEKRKLQNTSIHVFIIDNYSWDSL